MGRGQATGGQASTSCATWMSVRSRLTGTESIAAAFSSQAVTFTVLVDSDYEGPVTNTAVITHPTLLAPVVVQAVAYVTDDPVLFISKTASPDPVPVGTELAYTVRVVNAGQQATGLVITDVLPADTEYVAASATASGQLVGGRVRWTLPVLRVG